MNDNEKPFFLKLFKKEMLTSDCYSFYFKRDGSERNFSPGQYFEIKLKVKNPDELGDARVFTISSSPTNKEFFVITTRIIKSSFKLELGKLSLGSDVEFNGPWNDLNFDENEKLPYVFLAGGIGVTPYHSILGFCIDKKLQNNMTLFASWKKRDDMVFHNFFESAQKDLPNFKYTPTLTDDNVSDWNYEFGRIDEKLIKKYVKDFRNVKYLISGPPPMVKALKDLVISMDVKKENIISEDFEGYVNDKF